MKYIRSVLARLAKKWGRLQTGGVKRAAGDPLGYGARKSCMKDTGGFAWVTNTILVCDAKSQSYGRWHICRLASIPDRNTSVTLEDGWALKHMLHLVLAQRGIWQTEKQGDASLTT